MKKLSGCFEKDAINYLDLASKIAQYSTCLRSKCGALLVSSGEIIGQGYNSPPKSESLEKCIKNSYPLTSNQTLLAVFMLSKELY